MLFSSHLEAQKRSAVMSFFRSVASYVWQIVDEVHHVNVVLVVRYLTPMPYCIYIHIKCDAKCCSLLGARCYYHCFTATTKMHEERSFIWIADTYNACVSATSPFSERMQSKNKRWLPRITPQGIAEYVVAVKQ